MLRYIRCDHGQLLAPPGCGRQVLLLVSDAAQGLDQLRLEIVRRATAAVHNLHGILERSLVIRRLRQRIEQLAKGEALGGSPTLYGGDLAGLGDGLGQLAVLLQFLRLDDNLGDFLAELDRRYLSLRFSRQPGRLRPARP
ncbi:hypothetical protein E6W36_13790 [Hankyongella ginsenosidimutans]|uniref:Uncharacterized protein n=1 Tax=Hankyongella ginsenosidimutans TaxID=1763828 RepID=A0A4D7C7U9_9SPHN|nr:hypothetical protein [Hankyongella ginsenosidimutans]QCI80185.1 hypothetical protein E6W36_13790 [Hankyongella ginsenosidimutans]